jgi:hypothetical protein
LLAESGRGGDCFGRVGAFEALRVLQDEVSRLAGELEGRVGWVQRQVAGAAAADAERGDLRQSVDVFLE